VGRDRPIPNRPEGLKPIAAAFAVFALLIQALLPSAALAAQPSGGPLVVCTIAGAKTVQTEAAGRHAPKGFAGLPCQDCLAASVAALTPPLLSFEPAAAAFVLIAHPVRPVLCLALARAPPRPFGQGPPHA
jgi:hypothetical protein